MRSNISVLLATVAIFTATGCLANTTPGKPVNGKKAFEEHCSSCHANGGNSINPAKTLQKKVMEANGVRSAKDIVKLMRNPGPGMTRFDDKTISDKEAKAIADHILKTFK